MNTVIDLSALVKDNYVDNNDSQRINFILSIFTMYFTV